MCRLKLRKGTAFIALLCCAALTLCSCGSNASSTGDESAQNDNAKPDGESEATSDEEIETPTFDNLEDVENYLRQNPTEQLYFRDGEGGYYDDHRQTNLNRKILENGDILSSSWQYFGDFAVASFDKEYLDDYYEIHNKQYKELYFRGSELDGIKTISQFAYSEPYLFSLDSGTIQIFDLSGYRGEHLGDINVSGDYDKSLWCFANAGSAGQASESAEAPAPAEYSACKENIIATGTPRADDLFEGYEYAMPVAPGTTNYMKGSVGAKDESDHIWIIFEHLGNEPGMQGFSWTIELDGTVGKYDINVPLGVYEQKPFFATVRGSFETASYSDNNTYFADEVEITEGVLSEESEKDIGQKLKTYSEQVLPTSIDMLDYWLGHNGLGYSLQDLNIGGKNSPDTNTSASANTNSVAFTNKYGTPTTKCAHDGCSNYIASSGDTNCCTVHSNKCLECGKYIDEDAMYCMDCLSGVG